MTPAERNEKAREAVKRAIGLPACGDDTKLHGLTFGFVARLVAAGLEEGERLGAGAADPESKQP